MEGNLDSYGICCPECGSEHTEVTDTRPARYGIRRRRECKDCFYRFSTVEILKVYQDRYDIGPEGIAVLKRGIEALKKIIEEWDEADGE